MGKRRNANEYITTILVKILGKVMTRRLGRLKTHFTRKRVRGDTKSSSEVLLIL